MRYKTVVSPTDLRTLPIENSWSYFAESGFYFLFSTSKSRSFRTIKFRAYYIRFTQRLFSCRFHIIEKTLFFHYFTTFALLCVRITKFQKFFCSLACHIIWIFTTNSLPKQQKSLRLFRCSEVRAMEEGWGTPLYTPHKPLKQLFLFGCVTDCTLA